MAAHGLLLRGGFAFREEDRPPAGPDGRPAVSLLLVGNAGPAMWLHFEAWCQRRGMLPESPLDRWSGEVIGAVADRFGARAVFAFQKPYLPFQQWAKRAEGLKASPLGMLIHPRYGLWHAWRGALLFDAEIPIQDFEKVIHPCRNCREKPCLSACPVSAFSSSGFDAPRCSSYLDSMPSSQSDSSCRPNGMAMGCHARDACPVGREWRYGDDQVRFHMRAFARGSIG